jgi:hypothetical protein
MTNERVTPDTGMAVSATTHCSRLEFCFRVRLSRKSTTTAGLRAAAEAQLSSGAAR